MASARQPMSYVPEPGLPDNRALLQPNSRWGREQKDDQEVEEGEPRSKTKSESGRRNARVGQSGARLEEWTTGRFWLDSNSQWESNRRFDGWKASRSWKNERNQKVINKQLLLTILKKITTFLSSTRSCKTMRADLQILRDEVRQQNEKIRHERDETIKQLTVEAKSPSLESESIKEMLRLQSSATEKMLSEMRSLVDSVRRSIHDWNNAKGRQNKNNIFILWNGILKKNIIFVSLLINCV